MKELHLKTFENQDSGIDIFQFAERMEQHWTQELGNVSSKALRSTWMQIAHTFNWHIKCHDNPEWAKRWSILSPPTGAGKTESTVIYAAMLADLPLDFHPGMLIVTRLKADCDLIAERINRFGSVETAVAYHMDADVKLTDLCQYPVVVITHRAYELALDFLGNEGRIEKTWPFFHQWWPDNRRLVVVDECLDIVDHHRICLEDLRQTLSVIPQNIRKRFPDDTMTIETVIGLLEEIDRKSKGIIPQETMLLKGAVQQGVLPDLTGLIKALGEIRFDRQIGKDDAMECERLRKRHEQRLKSLHYVFRSWCYYSKHSMDHSMNCARLVVPDGVKGCCVMDATASTNLVYELHQDSSLLTPPEGSRCYGNFTLHVSRDHRVGKNHMSKNAKQLCSDLTRMFHESSDSSNCRSKILVQK